MPIILVGRLLQVLLMLFSIRLVTTYLTPIEFGQMSILLTLMAGFSVVFVSPVGIYVNRHLHIWEKNEETYSNMIRYFIYLLFVCGFSSLLSITLKSYLMPTLDISAFALMQLVFTYLLFTTTSQNLTAFLNILEHRYLYVILSVLALSISLGFSFCLVYYFNATSVVWLQGQVIVYAITALIFTLIFLRLIKGRSTRVFQENGIKGRVRSVFEFSWPLVLSIGLTWLQSQAYRFIVGDKLGLEVLALFVLGYGLSANIIASLEAVLSTYFQPAYFKSLVSNDKTVQASAWNRYSQTIFPVLLVTLVFITLFSKELTSLVVGPQFQSASKYVVWGAICDSCRVLTSTYALVAHAQRKTSSLLMPNIIAAIIALIGVSVLLRYWATFGVGIALTIASIACVILTHFKMKDLLPIAVPWSNILKASFYSLLLITLSKSSTLLFGFVENSWKEFGFLLIFSLFFMLIIFALLYDTFSKEELSDV